MYKNGKESSEECIIGKCLGKTTYIVKRSHVGTWEIPKPNEKMVYRRIRHEELIKFPWHFWHTDTTRNNQSNEYSNWEKKANWSLMLKKMTSFKIFTGTFSSPGEFFPHFDHSTNFCKDWLHVMGMDNAHFTKFFHGRWFYCFSSWLKCSSPCLVC